MAQLFCRTVKAITVHQDPKPQSLGVVKPGRDVICLANSRVEVVDALLDNRLKIVGVMLEKKTGQPTYSIVETNIPVDVADLVAD